MQPGDIIKYRVPKHYQGSPNEILMRSAESEGWLGVIRESDKSPGAHEVVWIDDPRAGVTPLGQLSPMLYCLKF